MTIENYQDLLSLPVIGEYDDVYGFLDDFEYKEGLALRHKVVTRILLEPDTRTLLMHQLDNEITNGFSEGLEIIEMPELPFGQLLAFGKMTDVEGVWVRVKILS